MHLQVRGGSPDLGGFHRAALNSHIWGPARSWLIQAGLSWDGSIPRLAFSCQNQWACFSQDNGRGAREQAQSPSLWTILATFVPHRLCSIGDTDIMLANEI